MKFEWSQTKAQTNYAKHGITFQMAQDAFSDPFALDWYDPRYEEDIRYCLLGSVESRILFVAYTELDNNTIRIISARLATGRERRLYHEENARD